MINVLFGSNRFIGVDIPLIFRFNDKDIELFKYELRAADSKPMINIEIRDSDGTLLGKVWKSTSFVHLHKDYDGIEEREGSEIKRMALIRKKDNATIFELIIHEPTNVEINGIFHVKGFEYPIIATKDALKIGGFTFSHNTIMKKGTGIILTRNGFMM